VQLEGKTAIITGGLNGIGYETAKYFAAEGANIGIMDLNVNNTRRVTEVVTKLHHMHAKNIHFFATDVTKMYEIKSACTMAYGIFGKIDILVNNAGITKDSSLKKMTEEQFDAVLDVNLKGLVNCTKCFSTQMIERKHSGVILNASSVVAANGNFGQTNYVCSKAAVSGLTVEWARELGPYGIRVNAVAPGFTKTAMTEKIPENIVEKITKTIPLGRFAEASEIAKAYLFLASDSASYITGTILEVDGGLVIGRPVI
jgi:3-oxoacyl-[acyl-carrier protein] reductase